MADVNRGWVRMTFTDDRERRLTVNIDNRRTIEWRQNLNKLEVQCTWTEDYALDIHQVDDIHQRRL